MREVQAMRAAWDVRRALTSERKPMGQLETPAAGGLVPVADAIGAEQRVGAGAARLAGLEWARLIACLGIVWFHVRAPGASIGYGGLITFTALSVSLAARPSREGVRLGEIVRSRASRLLGPWVFWSAVYAAVLMVPRLWETGRVEFPFRWWMVLAGTSLHLWYLPFAFVVTCLVPMIPRGGWWGGRGSAALWWGLTAVSIPVCAGVVFRFSEVAPPAQWVSVLPAALMGVAVARGPMTRGAGKWRVAGLWGLIAGGCGVAYAMGYEQPSVSMASGSALFLAAWMWRGAAGPRLLRLSSLSFGVYLIHPLFMRLVLRGWFFWERPAAAVAVACLSLATVALLRRSPLRGMV